MNLTVELDSVIVPVRVKNDSRGKCEGCYFHLDPGCAASNVGCSPYDRADHKEVVFKKINLQGGKSIEAINDLIDLVKGGNYGTVGKTEKV